MGLTRRHFFFGVGAAAVAVSAPISLRQVPFLWGDGVHDDTDALNAFFRGDRVETSAGIITRQDLLVGGVFRTTAPVVIAKSDIGWARSAVNCEAGECAVLIDGAQNVVFDRVTLNCDGLRPDGVALKLSADGSDLCVSDTKYHVMRAVCGA